MGYYPPKRYFPKAMKWETYEIPVKECKYNQWNYHERPMKLMA